MEKHVSENRILNRSLVFAKTIYFNLIGRFETL